jgi:hypothetical protein
MSWLSIDMLPPLLIGRDAAIAMALVALGITILVGKSQTLRAGETVAS